MYALHFIQSARSFRHRLGGARVLRVSIHTPATVNLLSPKSPYPPGTVHAGDTGHSVSAPVLLLRLSPYLWGARQIRIVSKIACRGNGHALTVTTTPVHQLRILSPVLRNNPIVRKCQMHHAATKRAPMDKITERNFRASVTNRKIDPL